MPICEGCEREYDNGKNLIHTCEDGDRIEVLEKKLENANALAAAHLRDIQLYEREYILPMFNWAKEIGLDLQKLVFQNHGKNCSELFVRHLIDRIQALEGAEPVRHRLTLHNIVLYLLKRLHEDGACPLCTLGHNGEDLGEPGLKHEEHCPLYGYELTVDLEALQKSSEPIAKHSGTASLPAFNEADVDRTTLRRCRELLGEVAKRFKKKGDGFIVPGMLSPKLVEKIQMFAGGAPCFPAGFFSDIQNGAAGVSDELEKELTTGFISDSSNESNVAERPASSLSNKQRKAELLEAGFQMIEQGLAPELMSPAAGPDVESRPSDAPAEEVTHCDHGVELARPCPWCPSPDPIRDAPVGPLTQALIDGKTLVNPEGHRITASVSDVHSAMPSKPEQRKNDAPCTCKHGLGVLGVGTLTNGCVVHDTRTQEAQPTSLPLVWRTINEKNPGHRWAKEGEPAPSVLARPASRSSEALLVCAVCDEPIPEDGGLCLGSTPDARYCGRACASRAHARAQRTNDAACTCLFEAMGSIAKCPKHGTEAKAHASRTQEAHLVRDPDSWGVDHDGVWHNVQGPLRKTRAEALADLDTVFAAGTHVDKAPSATPPPDIIRGRAIIEAALHWYERSQAGLVTALALAALEKAIRETPKEPRTDYPRIVEAARAAVEAWDSYGLFSEAHPDLRPAPDTNLGKAHAATRALRDACSAKANDQ